MAGGKKRRPYAGRRFEGVYSAFFLEDGAAAPAGDGNAPLPSGHPQILAAVGALEIAVLLIPVDGALQPQPPELLPKLRTKRKKKEKQEEEATEVTEENNA